MKAGIYMHDKIYFIWLPAQTENGFAWLQFIRDVLWSNNGENYEVSKREKYQHVRYRFFRDDGGTLQKHWFLKIIDSLKKSWL